MQQTTAQFKRQLPLNVFFQILSFLLRFGIGVWLVPYLVSHLGRAAYGLIPIAAIMTEYVNIITQSISGAVSRFLTIALQNKDYEEANKIFNTAFFSYLGLAIIQIPIFILILANANSIFNIPNELYKDAQILLLCSAAAFLVNLATSVYGVPIYALNRLDLIRSIDIFTQVFRLLGIISLFLLFHPSLRIIGYVDFFTRFIVCVANVIIGKKSAPLLKLSLSNFDWRKVRQLTMMGGWLIVNYIGFLLFLRIDIWVCNKFISAEAAGEYAALLQWSNNIRQGAQLLAGVISPMILIYYARSEINNLIRLNNLSVRVFSLIFAIPISFLCVFGATLISLWLGKEFTHLSPLLIFMLSHLVINLGVIPLFSIQTAFNKVKWPAIVTIIMGFINLLLAIVFIKYFKYGVYGVAIASAIVLTFKNAFFTPIYSALILKKNWYFFLKSYFSGLLFYSVLIVFELLLKNILNPQNWHTLISSALFVSFTGIFMLIFFIKREERVLLIELLPVQLKILFDKIAKG